MFRPFFNFKKTWSLLDHELRYEDNSYSIRCYKYAHSYFFLTKNLPPSNLLLFYAVYMDYVLSIQST
jgi:hypothetical protein